LIFIDPIKKIQKLGFSIIEDETLEYGLIQEKIIKINPSLEENFKRFLLAHLLGHYVLGHLEYRKSFEEKKENFNLESPNIFEDEANEYAANFLMPKEKIDFLLYKEGITDIEKMAKILKVSKTAMVYQLQNLNYISS